jgi:hypothetical protein
MKKNHRDPQTELDISWRTRELGPEVRRELFRKAMPSVKFASRADAPSAREHGGGDQPRAHERRTREGGWPGEHKRSSRSEGSDG